MQLSDFVLDTTRSTDPINSNVEDDPNPGGQGKVADFLTLQSLSYTGATLAIGVIWTFVQAVVKDDWAKGPLVPGVLAVLVMVAGLAASWSDLQDNGKRISATIIALFNAALLLAGAFGITVAATAAVAPTG